MAPALMPVRQQGAVAAAAAPTVLTFVARAAAAEHAARVQASASSVCVLMEHQACRSKGRWKRRRHGGGSLGPPRSPGA